MIYSAYLKLQERRILSKLQEDLQRLPTDDATSKEVEELVAMLETTKIQPKEQGYASLFLDEAMNNAVSGFMSEVLLENSVSSYLSNVLRKDLLVKSFITQHPELENSEQAATFLTRRMRSSGQVTDIPKEDSLRAFIETTDYKSAHNSESQRFLFSIAKMEEQHLETFYSPIIQTYNRFIGKNDQELQSETR